MHFPSELRRLCRENPFAHVSATWFRRTGQIQSDSDIDLQLYEWQQTRPVAQAVCVRQRKRYNILMVWLARSCGAPGVKVIYLELVLRCCLHAVSRSRDVQSLQSQDLWMCLCIHRGRSCHAKDASVMACCPGTLVTETRMATDLIPPKRRRK
jgi:hypothetical protein